MKAGKPRPKKARDAAERREQVAKARRIADRGKKEAEERIAFANPFGDAIPVNPEKEPANAMEALEQEEMKQMLEAHKQMRLKQDRIHKLRANRRELYEKMHSLIHRNGRRISNISLASLFDVFMGYSKSLRCQVGKSLVRINFNDIKIAYEAEYHTLDTFASIYDDEDGDYPIMTALRDAVTEAYIRKVVKINNETAKDKAMRLLSQSS